MKSLEKQALNASIWTVGSYGLGQALRFLNNVVLSWLLTPDLFGLMTLVSTFLMGIELFTDLGTGQSIIHNKRGDDPEFFNTAWTLQVVRGLVIWGVCFLISPWISQFYENRQLLIIMPLVGLRLIFAGFTSTSVMTLQRRLLSARKGIFGLGVYAIQLVSTVIWAVISPTIWALVGGAIVGGITQMIVSHFLLKDVKNRFHWDLAIAKELFNYGQWIFIASIIYFLAQQADRLILGKLVPLEILGVYGIAKSLADIFANVVLKLNNEVVFPFISRMAEVSREEIYNLVKPSRQKFLLLSGVGLGVPMVFGDYFVKLLYSEAYQDAGWMIPILLAGIWFSVLFKTCESSLKGLGKPIYTVPANLIKFVVVLLGVSWGYQTLGILGCILGVAISEFASYLALQYGLFREKFIFVGQDLLMTLYTIALVVGLGWIRWSVGLGTPLDGIHFNPI